MRTLERTFFDFQIFICLNSNIFSEVNKRLAAHTKPILWKERVGVLNEFAVLLTTKNSDWKRLFGKQKVKA